MDKLRGLGRLPALRSLRVNFRPVYRRFFPYASLNQLDRRVEKYLPAHGYFLEAGANDGLNQSNTLFLERKHRWNGILIEPVPRLAKKCLANRPEALIFQCALVAPELLGEQIELVDVDLMTVINEESHSKSLQEHLSTAEQVQGVKRTIIRVVGRTLSDVLVEANAPHVDFMSLDVEGYEVNVLHGLKSEHYPTWLLIETKRVRDVIDALGECFEIEEQITHHDYLLRNKLIIRSTD